MNPTRRALLAAVAASPAMLRGGEAMRRLGSLAVGKPEVLLQALATFGWEVGRNLHFEGRTVPRYGPADQRAAAARELLATHPEVVACETGACARAIVDAAPTMPVVASLWDPVLEGLAQSLGRPGRSVTGLSYEAPRGFIFMLETLRLLVPGLQRMHSLATPGFHSEPSFDWVRAEAKRALGIEIVMKDVATVDQAVKALDAVGDRRREAAFLFRVPGLDTSRVIQHALHAKVALTFIESRTGALLACNYVHYDSIRTIASLIDKVLRGASPATLPFERPARVQLEINRATARALGITIPPELLIRASELHG